MRRATRAQYPHPLTQGIGTRGCQKARLTHPRRAPHDPDAALPPAARATNALSDSNSSVRSNRSPSSPPKPPHHNHSAEHTRAQTLP